MAVEIIMPKLGLNMQEGTLIRWVAENGASVQKGDILYELETDKVTTEVEAEADGIVVHETPENTVVPVSHVVGYILKPGEPAPSVATQSTEAPAASPAPEPVTEKASSGPERPARINASPAAKRRAQELGVDIALVTGSSKDGRISIEDVETFAASQQAVPETPQPASAPARINASPAAKRRAQELGVDIAAVTGSGKDGRVSFEDVEAFAASQQVAPEVPATPESVPAAAVEVHASPLARRIAQDVGIDLATIQGSGRAGRIVRKDVEGSVSQSGGTGIPTASPIKGVRAVIFERMQASSQQTAPVTLTTEIDASALVRFRARINEHLGSRKGIRISFNDILVKVAASALREIPYMNAQLNENEIVLKSEVNIGVAVDTEKGLVVPVIRDADQKSILDINQELRDMAERALAGKSSPDDFGNGTFTITNLGAFGIDAFTPIINLPEIAILGVGRIVQKPVVHMGGIHIRERMALSLTFDHRLVDGAPAARFLQRIGQLIESLSLDA